MKLKALIVAAVLACAVSGNYTAHAAFPDSYDVVDVPTFTTGNPELDAAIDKLVDEADLALDIAEAAQEANDAKY